MEKPEEFVFPKLMNKPIMFIPNRKKDIFIEETIKWLKLLVDNVGSEREVYYSVRFMEVPNILNESEEEIANRNKFKIFSDKSNQLNRV